MANFTESTLKIGSVPWDSSYNHVVNFTDETAKREWFNDATPSGFSSNSYTIPGAVFIPPDRPYKVPIPWEQICSCNYLILEPSYPIVDESSLIEPDGDGKPINATLYYFILDSTYVAPNTTMLTLQIDVWQTFSAYVTLKSGLLERGHYAHSMITYGYSTSSDLTSMQVRRAIETVEPITPGSLTLLNTNFVPLREPGDIQPDTCYIVYSLYSLTLNPYDGTGQPVQPLATWSTSFGANYNLGVYILDHDAVLQLVSVLTGPRLAHIATGIIDIICVPTIGMAWNQMPQMQLHPEYRSITTRYLGYSLAREGMFSSYVTPIHNPQYTGPTDGITIESRAKGSPFVVYQATNNVGCSFTFTLSDLYYKGYNPYTDPNIPLSWDFMLFTQPGAYTLKAFPRFGSKTYPFIPAQSNDILTTSSFSPAGTQYTRQVYGKGADMPLTWTDCSHMSISTDGYSLWMTANREKIQYQYDAAETQLDTARRSANTALANGMTSLSASYANSIAASQQAYKNYEMGMKDSNYYDPITNNSRYVDRKSMGLVQGVASGGSIIGSVVNAAWGIHELATDTQAGFQHADMAHDRTMAYMKMSSDNAFRMKSANIAYGAGQDILSANHKLATYAAESDYSLKLQSIQADIAGAKLLPDSMQGNTAQGITFAQGGYGITIKCFGVTDTTDYNRNLVNFFKLYGWAYNAYIGDINEKLSSAFMMGGKTNRCYWKMTDTIISADKSDGVPTGLSEQNINALRGILAKGTTVYNNPMLIVERMSI